MRRIDIIETTYGTDSWSTSVNSLSIQFYVPWVTQVSHSIGRQSWFQTKQSKWLYFFAPTTMLFAPVWVSFLMKTVLFHLDWALIDHDQPLCWSDDIMCKVVHNKICTSFTTTFSVGIRGTVKSESADSSPPEEYHKPFLHPFPISKTSKTQETDMLRSKRYGI